jgi:hypothetical protein
MVFSFFLKILSNGAVNKARITVHKLLGFIEKKSARRRRRQKQQLNTL